MSELNRSSVDVREPVVDHEPPAVPSEKARDQNVRRQRLINGSATLAILVGALVFVEIGVREGFISSLILPRPSEVWRALADMFETGLVWPQLTSTLTGTVLGFLLASLLAFSIGGLIAVSQRFEAIFMPFVIALQTMPKIAVAPLIIIWAGFGMNSKVMIVTLVCFFPILINTIQGLRLRETDRYELLRSVGATKWQVFRYIRFPGSLPYIFAGLHIGVIFSLIGAVTAEFVGSRDGLGVLLLTQKSQFNVPGVYAVLLLFMVIGLIIDAVMTVTERRLTFWAQEKRPDSP